MFRVACWGLAVALLSTAPVCAQGRLRQARNDTIYRPSGPTPPTANSANSQDSSNSTNWGDGAGEAFGAALILATSPWWLPPLAIGDRTFGGGYFPHHPYPNNQPGYMQVDPTGNDLCYGQEATFLDPEYLKPWAVRFAVEDGNDFRGINRVGAQFALDTTWRFGLSSNWNLFTEQLDGGRSDSAALSDTNITYRFAQSDWVQLQTGVGLRMLNDSGGSRFGVNVLYGGDLFLWRPFVLSGVVDGGTLDSTWVFHTRGTIGYTRRSWEGFVGYDFLRIGSVNLQGPMAGLRFWF